MNDMAHGIWQTAGIPHAEQRLGELLGSMLDASSSRFQRITRYSLLVASLVTMIWLPIGFYCLFWPESWRSEMVLNLPSATARSNVTLENLGQTSTSSNSPFSELSLSPMVIYQQIAQSARVRGLVAKRLGISFDALPKPRIKLVDQTALITITMDAPTAAEARRYNATLLEALEDQLDALRRDEIERRALSVRASLSGVEDNLRAARKRLLDFQRSSAIISLDQFQTVTLNMEKLRQDLISRNAEHALTVSELGRLQTLLRMTPDEAAVALDIQSEPRFATLLEQRSAALTQFEGNKSRWGVNHPKMVAASAQIKSAERALRRLAGQILPPDVLKRLERVLLAGENGKRADLLEQIITLEARSNGSARAISSLEAAVEKLRQEIDSQASSAAQLADLERDHKIAETVFASALARVDTGRQDIYASYPLIQVLSEPSLPSKPAEPRLLLATAGGGLATFLAFLAVTLLCFRRRLIARILKSA